MKQRAVLMMFLLGGLASPAQAQRSTPYCWAGDVRTNALVDSLRQVAVRLYPQAVADARHTSSVQIAIVMDGECRITHHAIGVRRGPASIDTAIARLIPDVAGFRYSIGGYALLGRMSAGDSAQIGTDPRKDIGLPWLVWGVAKTPAVR